MHGELKMVPPLTSIILNKFYVELRELESLHIFKSSLTCLLITNSLSFLLFGYFVLL